MRRTTVAFALALVLGWTGHAFAQAEHYGNRPWELNVNAGAHFMDDDLFGEEEDTQFGAGLRMFMNQPSGWGFGGNFTWIPGSVDFGTEEVDFNLYLYSAEVEYTFGSSTRLHPFVGAGVGAATLKVEDVPDEFEDSETELLIPLGGGIKWFPRTTNSNWAVRVDVRDNIIFVSGDEDLGDSDETTHNFEISGGVSFLFGGG